MRQRGAGAHFQGLAIGRYGLSQEGRARLARRARLGLRQDIAQVGLDRGPVLWQRGAGEDLQGLAIGRYGLGQEGRARLARRALALGLQDIAQVGLGRGPAL